MKRLAVLMALMLAVAGSPVAAEDDPAAAPKRVKISDYPAAVQADSKVFQASCSRCHSLQQAIGKEYLVPTSVDKLIHLMQAKENSGISHEEVPTIYRFMVYDIRVRRPGELRQALQALTPEESAKEIERLNQVLAWYAEKESK